MTPPSSAYETNPDTPAHRILVSRHAPMAWLHRLCLQKTLALSSVALLLSACGPRPYICEYRVNHVELCDQELASGNLSRAETYCDLGLEFSPEFADLWALKGRIERLRDNPAKAKEHFLRALRYAPDHQQALLYLGFTHLEEGAYELAREHFTQALKADPKLLDARHGLGSALMALGRREEARKELTAVRNADPGNADVHRALGRLEFKERNLEAARQHVSRATQLAPEDSYNWRNLGAVLLHQRRFSEAEAAFLRCMSLPEPYPDCQEGLERARRLPEEAAAPSPP
ncbi:tetratricopeptide repeat protein [Myxococcus sp. Y35]|uniref:tetratricopeptide repeat protein n=1 Tax=Pseudomyxococcus flavus TaxID=3115648 RepID=UPI003CFBB237